MSDQERFDRLREIVGRARALEGQEREAYLDVACDGDEGLAAEVRALLSYDGRSESLDLAAPVQRVARAAVSEGVAHPSRLGPYRIVREIARGGMAVVYEATQERPRRVVALKVIHAHTRSLERNRQLFEREIQALALLDHPSIAQIHDAGETDDGVLYFAMERIDGETLQVFRRRRAGDAPLPRKELRAWIRLFLEACAPIAHAHRRGVIHRDLKPSNVMVVAPREGAEEIERHSVKVLDFGIARILELESGATATLSQQGQLLGTLAYMSPEQALGEASAVDVRSDVHALGVMLFELITGRLPTDLADVGIAEAIRRIREDVPRSCREFTPEVPADLETIVSTAMDRDIDLRYESVAALAEDLDRFLSDRPILARAPDVLYQIRKFAARHRARAALSMAAVVLLVAGAIGASVTAHVQTRERRRADRAVVRAERVNQLLQELLSSSSPLEKGGEITVRQMLDEAATRIDDVEDPVITASIRRTLGATYSGLFRFAEAQQQFRAALADLDRDRDPPPLLRASILTDLGTAAWYGSDTYSSEAVQVWIDALAIRQRELGAHDDTASLMNNLGVAAMRRGDLEDAEAWFRESLDTTRRAGGEASPRISQRMAQLARVVERRGDAAGAETLLRQALEHARRHSPSGTMWRLSALADFLVRADRWSEAEEVYVEARSLTREAYGDDPRLPTIETQLAHLAWRRGDLRAASSLEAEIGAMLGRVPEASARIVADATEVRCRIALARGDVAAADSLRRAWHASHDPSSVDFAERVTCHLLAARIARGSGDPRSALAALDSVGAIDAGSPHEAELRILEARSWIDLGRWAEADAALQAALRVEGSSPSDWETVVARVEGAVVALRRGELAIADTLWSAERARFLEGDLVPHFERVDVLDRLGGDAGLESARVDLQPRRSNSPRRATAGADAGN